MSQEKAQQQTPNQEYQELDINSFLLPAVKQVYNAGANKKGIQLQQQQQQQQQVQQSQSKKKQQKFQPGNKTFYQNQGLGKKKGDEHKTFYHFTKIYKVDDFKFLSENPQQQQQENLSNLDISQRNLADTNLNFQKEQVQILRDNVENYLVMKKYHKKDALRKFKESLKHKKNNDSTIYQFKEEIQDPVIKEHFEKKASQHEELQKDQKVINEVENNPKNKKPKEQIKEEEKKLTLPLVNLNVIISDGEGEHKQMIQQIGPNKIQKQFLRKYYRFLNTSKYDTNFIVQKMTSDYQILLEKLKTKDLKVKIRVPKNVQAQMSDYNDYYVRIQGIKDEFEQSDIKNEEKELQQDENVSKILNQVIEEQLEVPKGTDGSQDSLNEQTDEEKQVKEEENEIGSNSAMRIQLNEPEDDNQYHVEVKQEQTEEQKTTQSKISINVQNNLESVKEEAKQDEPKPQQNAMSIIDQLLEAKDVFDVDLSSLKPKPEKYPQIPTDIIFRSKEEKQIFEKLYNWLFEIEMDLNRERKEIQEQKRIRNQVLYDSEQIKQDIEGDSSADEGDDDDDEDDDEDKK